MNLQQAIEQVQTIEPKQEKNKIAFPLVIRAAEKWLHHEQAQRSLREKHGWRNPFGE